MYTRYVYRGLSGGQRHNLAGTEVQPVRGPVQVDQQFSRQKGRATCGTTATTVIVRDEAIHVAHCGDSRAVLISDNSVWPLTKDHKPSDPQEAERIRVRAPDASGFCSAV